MLKQRIALAQAQGTFRDFQEFPGVVAVFSLKPSGGGGVVAGVQPQYRSHGSSLLFVFYNQFSLGAGRFFVLELFWELSPDKRA